MFFALAAVLLACNGPRDPPVVPAPRTGTADLEIIPTAGMCSARSISVVTVLSRRSTMLEHPPMQLGDKRISQDELVSDYTLQVDQQIWGEGAPTQIRLAGGVLPDGTLGWPSDGYVAEHGERLILWTRPHDNPGRRVVALQSLKKVRHMEAEAVQQQVLTAVQRHQPNCPEP